MIRNCLECNKEFRPPQKEINRGNGKVCSKQCSRARGRKSVRDKAIKARITVTCAYCDVIFSKPSSKMKNARHGVYFCSRAHKDLAQRIGGVKVIQPSHYGEVTKEYRSTAFRAYEHKCADCGYEKVLDILVVHHIDSNRNNNDLSNLVILCPNCHAIRHREIYS